ncbi:phosphatase PAP2 family protein [Streptacidiphilus jiangxiensis]|uniref:PAP2 superfamily protein n=1 Tax=Streptacidiphilus jiangxiensis TaxID=235985 RepID=A0A1H7VG21_STRJI|nr:phosphatase PAP2 family protein [Streptacidiphilus jiangxiensis]SEM08050.1 PAP2 superfamily protein [Streptacidiphilus jiangxiensis]
MAGTVARGGIDATDGTTPPALPRSGASPGGTPPHQQPGPDRPGLLQRIRRWKPRQWGLELVLLVYAAYDGSRLLVHGKESVAREHGELLLRTERHLHAEPEHWLNRLFSEHAWLGVPADFIYASLHYAITPLVLFWMFRSRRAHYAYARTWLVLATALGLVGFVFFPTAPPRLLSDPDGFLDVMAQHAHVGWWGGSGSAPEGLGAMTNDFAAFPSLHFGWALWCGLLIHRHARRRWVRVLGLLYPALILVVVMGTANHYLLDCVAGGAVVLLGRLLTGPLQRLAARVRRLVSRKPNAPVPDYPVTAGASATATEITVGNRAQIGAQRGPSE